MGVTPNFKVGDKVKILAHQQYRATGAKEGIGDNGVGKITLIDEVSDNYYILRDYMNGDKYYGFYIDGEIELVKEENNMKFKVGDKLRILSDECGNVEKADAEYIIITSVSTSYYGFTGYNCNDEVVGNCAGCFYDGHLEYYINGQEGVTKVARRTFKLVKDTPTMVKGALLQEQCDDGTQPYIMLNQDTHCKDPSYKIAFAKRSLVEEQPTWFVEVFAVQPQYMTQPELDQFEAFKKALKAKPVVKAAKKAKK